jgi:ribonuclease HI
LRTLHRVDFRWVKGHAGDPGNERADALANKGCAGA